MWSGYVVWSWELRWACPGGRDGIPLDEGLEPRQVCRGDTGQTRVGLCWRGRVKQRAGLEEEWARSLTVVWLCRLLP